MNKQTRQVIQDITQNKNIETITLDQLKEELKSVKTVLDYNDGKGELPEGAFRIAT
jgi:hypothetical protein